MILAFVCVCEYSICNWEKVFYLLTCILKAQQFGFYVPDVSVP